LLHVVVVQLFIVTSIFISS